MRFPPSYPATTLSALAAALTLLSACGGGGGAANPPMATASSPSGPKAAAALYFTDDFSAEYEAVWIAVSKVVVVNAAGVETELVSFAPSKRLNISQLRQAGSWAGAVQVPTDATAIRVYADASAQLQRLDGTMLNVSLGLTGGYLTFKLDSWDRSSGVLALDFDLPRFTLQGTTLTAATRVAGTSEYSGWNYRDAEIKGTVVNVTGTALTVDAGSHGNRVVTLDANTSFFSPVNPGWQPAIGDSVEVYSTVSGQGVDLQFKARVVKQRTPSTAANSTEVKGNVTAVRGSIVTLNVTSAGYGGPTGLVELDLRDANFKRGSLASLAVGVRLEVYLVPRGTGWSVVAVEVDGAAKPGQAAKSDYSELKGRVVSISGTQVTFTPTFNQRYGATLAPGNVTVDLATATFEKSALSCLAVGTPIEVKGYLDASGAFRVTRVDAEGACAAAVPAQGVTAASGTSDSSRMDGLRVEAKGTITALRNGELDITVYSLEGFASSTSTLTVRFSTNTYFEGVSPATLAVGHFVEAKGTMRAGVLEATKIELD